MPAYFVRALLLALAVALMGPSAHAQQETADERQYVTADEALELSRPSCDTCPGHVVLHVGEGYRERTLRGDIRRLIDRNISVIAVNGYDEIGVAVYISVNRITDSIDNPVSFDADSMAALLAEIVRWNNSGRINVSR